MELYPSCANDNECFVLLCFEGQGWLTSATCVPWCLQRAHTLLSKYGAPVFPHFPGPAPVWTKGGGGG